MKHLIGKHKIRAICLIETRVKESKYVDIKKKFGYKWMWTTNYMCSHKGRLWIDGMWNL